ncbi:MAG TPA: hypothetical protein VMW68_08995 [Methyloceanibacter sp.]|nr:hypothetical protein [Methyloceanibacter sp.]
MSIMDHAAAPPPPPLKERLAPTFERLDRALKPLGLGWVVPIGRLSVGDRPQQQAKTIWHTLMVPLIAIAVFLAL